MDKTCVRNGMAAGTVPGAAWRKSHHSNPDGSCVELSPLPRTHGVAMRNSRDPHGPALIFTSAEMEAFMLGVKSGEFDDLLG